MPSSIIVPLRQAVIRGLRDESGLADFHVTYAWEPASVEQKQVFTKNPRSTHDPAAMKSGRNHRNQQGTFEVVIHVELPGLDDEAADLEAMRAGLVVEEFLADRKSNELGVTGLNWLRIESDEGPSGGRTEVSTISQLMYTVRYDARLT